MSGIGPDAEREHPDLLGLLRGELDNAAVGRVADHLDDCDECREELAGLAVGHSLLAATTRTLDGHRRVEPLEPPARRAPTPPPWWRRRAVAVAAAVALVAATAGITAGITAGVLGEREERPPGRQVAAPEQEAVFHRLDSPSGSGRVTMAGSDDRSTTMSIRTTHLPRLHRGDYYYVWLLDPATQKMLPVGQIGADGTATFRLPLSLLGRYSAIDVSLEADNGDPGHSVTSVLRAEYDPGAAGPVTS